MTDARGRALAPGLGRWLREVSPAKARGTVHVAIVSDHRVRTLNRTYRGIDRPTDVLSFATTADERSAAPPGVGANGTRRADAHARRQGAQAEFLGDIVIARGVARRQARAAGHGEATELRVLALHGLLHLLGYDHEHDGGQMARIERRLRQRGGLRKGLIERR